MKKPTYKEQSEFHLKMIFVTMILFTIGMIIFGVIMDTRYNYLLAENEELKEQIKDAWELKVVCPADFRSQDIINESVSIWFNNYSLYNKAKQELIEDKYDLKCEVLEWKEVEG